MKFLIAENRAQEIIYKYLTDVYYPDYNWGPELHDFYREDVKKHGGYEFEVNDTLAYSYYDDEDYDKGLVIAEWLVERLDSLFGNMWQPVFIAWFEDNSGLKVKSIET